MSAIIPVYEAQTFEKEMDGGRNHPWLLSIDTGKGIELYVAKFFVQRDISEIIKQRTKPKPCSSDKCNSAVF